MDKLSKDEVWARTDEIDYNQKLVFSDDDLSDSPTPNNASSKSGQSKRGSDKDKDRDKDKESQSRHNEDNRTGE